MAPRKENLNKSQTHNGKLAAKANEPFKKSNKDKNFQGKHSTDQLSSLLVQVVDSEFPRGGSILNRGDGTSGRLPNFAEGTTPKKEDVNMDHVDEFYFSALIDDNELLPISDIKYAEELQLQEVLSSFTKPVKKENIASSSKSTSIKKVQFSSPPAPRTTAKIKAEPSLCKICFETPPKSHMFANKNCLHAFCNDCLRRYIGTKIKENVTAIKCPEEGCRGMIEPENCQGIIPKEVFQRWGDALCEAVILGGKKYSYCPYRDCSALLLNDENVDQCECPSCNRLFCAKCEVVWHAGLSCKEVKSLGVRDREAEDFRLIQIAKSNKWKKCPQCKFFVERSEGCLHITCRCKYEFCYRCGKKWSDVHASC